MYEAPIEIIMGNLQTEYEDGILKTAWKYNIHCDKEELIKALAYDRDQYRKGYRDGRAERVGYWIEGQTAGQRFVKCSRCGHIEFDSTPNYCEDCGAKMEGEQNE